MTAIHVMEITAGKRPSRWQYRLKLFWWAIEPKLSVGLAWEWRWACLKAAIL